MGVNTLICCLTFFCSGVVIAEGVLSGSDFLTHGRPCLLLFILKLELQQSSIFSSLCWIKNVAWPFFI